MHDEEPKNSYTKNTTKLLLFSILRRTLSKFITQTGLYCSKQLETTFHQFCEKPLHITFKGTKVRHVSGVIPNRLADLSCKLDNGNFSLL